MSNNLKSFGQALDEYLAEHPYYETIFIYNDKDATPHIVITNAEESHDYTNVFSEAIDLRAEIEAGKKEVERLQAKIRSLERDKKSVELAIAKLVKYAAPATNPDDTTGEGR